MEAIIQELLQEIYQVKRFAADRFPDAPLLLFTLHQFLHSCYYCLLSTISGGYKYPYFGPSFRLISSILGINL